MRHKIALEFRYKNGKLIKHWFGRCFIDGRAKVFSLSTPIKGLPPLKDGRITLLGEGDTKFEVSRAIAKKEFEEREADARQKGRADHLTERLIESKTGHKWKVIPLKDLEAFTANMKKGRSTSWAKWQCKVISRFVEWTKDQGIKTILHVTTDTAEKYLKKVSDGSKTAETMKHVKGVFVRVFDRALPQGVNNPFKGVHIQTEDDREKRGNMEHRTPLSQEEENLLLQISRETDPFIYQLIVTALSTGLRRGDVCRLMWSGVNFKNNSLTVRTSKTGEEVILPIMPTFREVLETQLARKTGKAIYVFPEAQRMIETNPDGITYRVKRALALTFTEMAKDTSEDPQDKPKPVTLSDVLPKVLEAVQQTKMLNSKRFKMIDILNLYASGKSYREIQETWEISRGAISSLLHLAQEISKYQFVPERNGNGSLRKAIQDCTRKKRTAGTRRASKYDFHSFRTTFCTMAINGGFPIANLKVLTGHRTVETVLKYYFKPKGTDFASQLEAVMPSGLLGSKPQNPLPVSNSDKMKAIVEALGELSKEEKTELKKLISS